MVKDVYRSAGTLSIRNAWRLERSICLPKIFLRVTRTLSQLAISLAIGNSLLLQAQPKGMRILRQMRHKFSKNSSKIVSLCAPFLLLNKGFFAASDGTDVFSTHRGGG